MGDLVEEAALIERLAEGVDAAKVPILVEFGLNYRRLAREVVAENLARGMTPAEVELLVRIHARVLTETADEIARGALEDFRRSAN